MDIVFKVFGFILTVLIINVLSNINENLARIAYMLGSDDDEE